MTKPATNIVTGNTDGSDLTEELFAELQKMPLRVELGFAFGIAGTADIATLYSKNDNNRWVKSLPFITGPEGCDRGDILQLLADAWRTATDKPRSPLAIVKTTTQGGHEAYDIFDRIQASDEEREFIGGIIYNGITWVFTAENVHHDWTPAELEHLGFFIRGLQ